MSGGRARAPGLPSVARQKEFIRENAGILNRETRLAILSLVMMEVGQTVVLGAEGGAPGREATVVFETGGAATEVDVDLDVLALANEEVVGHIYNIVAARRESLNHPAGTG